MTRTEFVNRARRISAEMLVEREGDAHSDVHEVEKSLIRCFATNAKTGDRLIWLLHFKARAVFVATYSIDTHDVSVKMYSEVSRKAVQRDSV